MSLGAIVNPSAYTGFAYDAVRDAIHFTTADGILTTWSVSEQRYTGSIQIGGTPGAVDVTPDGRFALIGNKTPIDTSPAGASGWDLTFINQITRVNLGTGAVDRIEFGVSGYERGISDLAIAADNTVLLTTEFAGSGWNTFRSFQADANFPVFTKVVGLNSIRQSSYLTVSDDRQHILVQEANISNAPFHVYSAAADQITFSNNLYNLGTSGFNSGMGDYNEARGLVLQIASGRNYVLSSTLELVTDLNSFTGSGSILNGAFDNDGAHLFLWTPSARKVLVIDTLTWKQVGQLSLQTNGGRGLWT